MKKKNIMLIIIGIVLICGIGYTIYQKIEGNKEDYFVVSYEGSDKEILVYMEEKNIKVIDRYRFENMNSGGIKIYTKYKTREEMRKIDNIKYLVKVNGLKDKVGEVGAEIYVGTESNKKDYRKMKERIEGLLKKEISYNSSLNNFYIKDITFEEAEKIKKEEFVFSILEPVNISVDLD